MIAMRKRIKISLHPVFTLISSIYLLSFFTYGVKSLKSLIMSGYSQTEIFGLILSILAISIFAYLALVRYRTIEIYSDHYLLKSIVATRRIDFNEIHTIKKVPLNFFHLRLGSVGLMGVISFTSKPEHYNVSDLGNTIRIALKSNEILHISCDKPEELIQSV